MFNKLFNKQEYDDAEIIIEIVEHGENFLVLCLTCVCSKLQVTGSLVIGPCIRINDK